MDKYTILKNKFDRRAKVYGTTMSVIDNPIIVEKMNIPDLDFILFDCEHGRFDDSNVSLLLHICRLIGLPVITRARDSEYHLIAKLIDMGADGIMLPRTETNEQLRTAIDSITFYPKGKKGVGGFGQFKKGESFAEFQESRFFMPQIESPKGIQNLPAMLDEYGEYISAVIIGPNDMSVMSGTPLDTKSDIMNQQIKEVFDICKKYDKSCGIFCNDAAEAKYYKEMGANVFWTASDVQFYMRGFTETARELAEI